MCTGYICLLCANADMYTCQQVYMSTYMFVNMYPRRICMFVYMLTICIQNLRVNVWTCEHGVCPHVPSMVWYACTLADMYTYQSAYMH